jgi:AraC family transcriptional activator of pobA
MATVPHFQLYGEGDSFADPGFVHIETIASRSRLNGWEIRPHSHDTLDQLLVIRSGEFEVRIDGRTITLAGAALIHIPACAVHGFRFDDAVAGDVLTFSAELRGSLVASQPAPIADQPFARAVGLASLERLTPLLTQLHVECSGHEAGRIAASAWLVGLLLLQVGRIAGESGVPLAGDTRVTTFRQLVDRHFREHRPLGFYADALGMTERSLTRLAQARLGCAPAHYLHRRLLLEARRQLAYGSQPIARIADELGFADPSYFTRFYRRMTGELPSAVRAS